MNLSRFFPARLSTAEPDGILECRTSTHDPSTSFQSFPELALDRGRYRLAEKPVVLPLRKEADTKQLAQTIRDGTGSTTERAHQLALPPCRSGCHRRGLVCPSNDQDLLHREDALVRLLTVSSMSSTGRQDFEITPFEVDCLGEKFKHLGSEGGSFIHSFLKDIWIRFLDIFNGRKIKL